MNDVHGGPIHPEIPQWAEDEAWAALVQAGRIIKLPAPRHRLAGGLWKQLPEWEYRGAPSRGARAGAILRGLLFPPSYIRKCEEALTLYLADWELAERPGFHRVRPRMGGAR